MDDVVTDDTGEESRLWRRDRPVAVVIDEDPDVSDLLHFRLERMGFKVWTAGDGREGLNIMHDVLPNLAIIEWTIPGRPGRELLKDLRHDTMLRWTRTLLITSRGEPPYRDTARRLGADAVLTKPFRGPDLQRTVMNLMAGRFDLQWHYSVSEYSPTSLSS